MNAATIASVTMKEAVKRANIDPAIIDDIRYGCCMEPADALNVTRVSALLAGIPDTVTAATINRVCISGMEAVLSGMAMIQAGMADVILAGGQESMSTVPMALPKARWGHRMELTGVGDIYDLMVFDGLYEIFYGYHMGVTAENIAEMYAIGRQEQDELGVLSHTRARSAIQAVSLALGAGLFLDIFKSAFGDVQHLIFSSFQPSLIDHSYLNDVQRIVSGYSDVLIDDRIHQLNLWVPIPEALLFLLITLIVIHRRNL